MTINQWRIIDHLLRLANRPGLPVADMARMTYADAAALIVKLQERP